MIKRFGRKSKWQSCRKLRQKLQKGISVSSNEEVYFALLDLVKD